MNPNAEKTGSWTIITRNMRQYSMFVALLLIMGVSHLLTGGLFLTPRNLNNLFLQTGYIAVLAIGMVLVIIGGEIDLAVGSIVAFCASIAAYLQVRHGMGTITVILIALILGVGAGGLQGVLVAYGGIPAFIVTLAGLMFFRGAVLAITGGNTLGPFSENFSKIGSGYLPDIVEGATLGGRPFNVSAALVGAALLVTLVVIQIRKRRRRIQYGFEVPGPGFFALQLLVQSAIIAFFTYNLASYKGLPYTVIVVGAFVVLYSHLARRTKIGRGIYAVGGNAAAAELSGINVRFVRFMMFVSMGLLTGVSGMLFAARMSTASPSTGTSFELEAIAASYVGGVSARGGIGTIIGAVIGALVIASINNCMSLLNANVWLQYMVKGSVLVLAVSFDIMTRRKK